MKYAYGFGEEFYDDQCDSIEDALERARGELELEGDNVTDSVYIGEVTPFYPHVDAEDIVNQIQLDAEHECDDAAIGYLDTATPENIAELSELLTAVFEAWAKKHDLEPDFYSIQKIKIYSLADVSVIDE